MVRLPQVQAQAAWLQGDPTGSGDPDVLVIGDMNSYLQEDPIDAFRGAGYDVLLENFIGGDAYSYTFDRQVGALDHALSSPSLTPQVTEVAEWHINADEADALDYNLDLGRNAAIFDGASEFRSSDHDPVVVGLSLSSTTDSDRDGVDDELDVCPDTVIPERAPTRRLRFGRYALTDDDTGFDTIGGRFAPRYTTLDTAGCSCEQIVDRAFYAGRLNLYYGCSRAVMLIWSRQVNR